jgi:hypothetical protein
MGMTIPATCFHFFNCASSEKALVTPSTGSLPFPNAFWGRLFVRFLRHLGQQLI